MLMLIFKAGGLLVWTKLLKYRLLNYLSIWY